jgi:hypothetical protein
MTNGVVSITRVGRVIVKAVCGCDGYNAGHLAGAIRRLRLEAKDEVYMAALGAGFGCRECLVVQDADGERYEGPGDLGPLYREEFADPTFNPRWERGDGACTRVVDLDAAEEPTKEEA